MTRLTDLIRGQSSQEAVCPDTNSSIRSIGPTGLPIPSPMCSPSIAETDWYQCAYQELQGIKRAVQTRQPWAVDELARIASGVVASLRAHDKLVQTVLQHNAGDYLVSNAVNVAIVSVKIAEALRYESAKREQVAFAARSRYVRLPNALVQGRALQEEELQDIREHPHHGARLFKDVGDAYAWAGRVIFREHERGRQRLSQPADR